MALLSSSSSTMSVAGISILFYPSPRISALVFSSLTFPVLHRDIYADGTADAVKFLARQIVAKADKRLYSMIDVLRMGGMWWVSYIIVGSLCWTRPYRAVQLAGQKHKLQSSKCQIIESPLHEQNSTMYANKMTSRHLQRSLREPEPIEGETLYDQRKKWHFWDFWDFWDF